jgi:NADH:ubiquinone oxidoreductase subunit 2 (subunit N)
MTFDLATPGGLMGALGPDLVLIAGAMVLMLMAAWRPESAAQQRTVGLSALAVIAATVAVTVWYAASASAAGDGIIAVDGFRWASDLVFLAWSLASRTCWCCLPPPA